MNAVSNLRIAMLVFCAGLPFAGPVVADDAISTSSQGKPVFVSNVPDDAVEAVAAVDAFTAALKSAKLEDARALLDSEVVILESGGSERSRDEYMAGHAAADANFMKSVSQQLRYRKASREGNFAWVATQSDLAATKDGKLSVTVSTETMLLRRTDAGWRIVHIHWSSKAAGTR